MTTPGAVVLCGGRSRRMGRPKAWLPFGDEALLQRVVRRVGAAARPVVAELLASGRLKPTSLAEVVRTRVVTPVELAGVDPGLRTLRNLNTPEDYAAALREAASEGCP